jgi:hypothetical protein
MAFPDNNHLDLFELNSKTLEKINEQGKVKLGNFDLSYQFSRDSNHLDAQLNFHLLIFEEEFSKTIYSKKYNTVEKMLKLLISNLKKEYMYKNVRDGLILTKSKSLKSHLYETIKAIKQRMIEVNDGSELGIYIDIEEDRKNKKMQKNGMPNFVLTVKCNTKKVDIALPLENNASDWELKSILAALNKQLEA